MNTSDDDPTGQPAGLPFGIRSVARGTPLHAGNIVYRVIEIDPPPTIQEPHTWKVAAAVIEHASPRQIRLKAMFPGLARLVFEPSAFGRIFFETPLQAIQFFLASQRLEIEAIDRKRQQAERAVAWALRQEGVTP